MKASNEQRLYRVAKLLFWMPVVLFIPVFMYVRDAVPDMNRGSIGDGFRKLNVFFAVMFPVGILLWLSALGTLTYVELPKLPTFRRWFVGLLLLTFVALFVAAVIYEYGRQRAIMDSQKKIANTAHANKPQDTATRN